MDCRVLVQMISHFQKRINLYATIILSFSYHFLFEKDLPCTCNNFIRDCVLYMLLPFSIIFMAQLWMDRSLQRSFRVCRRYCCCQGNIIDCFWGDNCCLVVSHLSSVFFVSCIWPISLLIDGDWSACCWSQSSHNITCKSDNLHTDEERGIVGAVKNNSRVAGLSILLGLFFLAFLISCCRNNSECFKITGWLEIVFEEEEKIISEKLREKAIEDLQVKMNNLQNQNWAKDFTIESSMIDYLAAPKPVPGPPPMATSGTDNPGTANIPLSDVGATSGAPSQASAEWTSQQENRTPLLHEQSNKE